MCGIVGYIGQKDAKEILLNGLEKLEYRGYDSAGIALLNYEGIQMTKVKGRVSVLREKADDGICGSFGIGHTRWATHGAPSTINAHPHQSKSGRFTLVHNGVIENYNRLKKDFLLDVPVVSETDTEIVAQLMEVFFEKHQNTLVAFRETMKQLKGSYAIAMIDTQNPETMYVSKNKSPLLIGLGDGFNLVASDAMATLAETIRYMEIHDEEIVQISRNHVVIQTLEGNQLKRESFIVEMDVTDTEKGTYQHYMLKEIDEQPFVIRKIIEKYQDENNNIAIGDNIRHAISQADRVYIIAAGTSYHAGLVGKSFLEKLTGIPTEVHIASEFNYNMPVLEENAFFIIISQSGETADCRSALVEIKKMAYEALTITNVPGSTLSREATYTLPLHAGPEIAVASTKAYTAQLAVLAILAVDVARALGVVPNFDLFQELAIVANAVEVLTDQKDRIENFAYDYLETSRNAFFIGRNLDYYVVLEAALKLKEISYIQAEGFAGGELKHGTIALIEENTPVIALATQQNVNSAIRSNLQEVAARGAKTMVISLDGLHEEDDGLVLPKVHELLTPLISVVPFQLLAYYAALHRDCDVDKPRNLAKSVTVE
ncbi:glutamine--fructose-6-phosphate transaminase (isomerizing) [Oceanobacillus sp. CAU 1775]